jgi:hypothetical protein
MSYDTRVYELVKHFLEAVPEKNSERNRQLLAPPRRPRVSIRPLRPRR